MTDEAAETGENTSSADEDFSALLVESLQSRDIVERTVVTGTIISIENDLALIDVGLKAEGRVPVKEFGTPGQPAEIKVGDEVEVYLARFENRDGEAVLSRDKARREEAWSQLERAFNDGTRVDGAIVGRVKGGFTVDLGGLHAVAVEQGHG